MIGLDTNILVRLLVKDDQRQGEAATAYIRNAVAEEDTCFINLIVLCELIWVLESAYGYGKSDISNALDKMLATRQFEIEAKDLARHAIQDYRHGKGDIEDYLIGRVNQSHGCNRTATFDRSLKSSPLFEVIG